MENIENIMETLSMYHKHIGLVTSSVESVKSVIGEGGRRGGVIVTMSSSGWGMESSSASFPGVSSVSIVQVRLEFR